MLQIKSHTNICMRIYVYGNIDLTSFAIGLLDYFPDNGIFFLILLLNPFWFQTVQCTNAYTFKVCSNILNMITLWYYCFVVSVFIVVLFVIPLLFMLDNLLYYLLGQVCFSWADYKVPVRNMFYNTTVSRHDLRIYTYIHTNC